MGPILVTGASGLVGRALVPNLRAAGLESVSTSLSSSDVDEPGHDLAVDAVSLVDKVRPAVIVHLAGGIGGDGTSLHRNNVVATVNLMHAATRLERKPYVVLLGSAAEYGEGNGSALSEQSPLSPLSDYGRTKVLQTTSAAEIADRAGVQLTVVRPFNVVAANLPASTALGRIRDSMIRAESTEPTITCGRLDIVRDYVALELVAKTIQFLVDRRPEVPVINVCSGAGIALGKVLDAMAEELGLNPRFVEDPALASLPAARRVVGDPTLLGSLIGPLEALDAYGIARIVLGRQA